MRKCGARQVGRQTANRKSISSQLIQAQQGMVNGQGGMPGVGMNPQVVCRTTNKEATNAIGGWLNGFGLWGNYAECRSMSEMGVSSSYRHGRSKLQASRMITGEERAASVYREAGREGGYRKGLDRLS